MIDIHFIHNIRIYKVILFLRVFISKSKIELLQNMIQYTNVIYTQK